ncbi:MAG TPA: amidohydrolase family protein, partial [Vicinamibacterales bacterium]|nr:amidohydrolase family protein [Vicinamibacterales bacterium]
MPASNRAGQCTVALASALAIACGQPAAPPDPIDLLVTNARIIDGTGAPVREGAVAVHGGHVTAVLDATAAAAAATRAARVIDARGRVVTPGFIDLHSHSDMPLVTDGNAQSKVRQGVTTEVIGESSSIAPLKAATEHQPWTDFSGYFGLLEKQGIAVNLVSYVGLGTARELVIGNDNRPPTPAELAAMQDLVTASMQQGAAGVSTGLIYPPNAFATLDELVALASPAARLGGRYASHLRHDGKRLREGIEEAIAIGERAKLPVHVFHVKVTGQKNFGRMKEIVALVEAARARGVQVTADVYPYVASSTSLTATLPQWVLDGGPDALMKNLS